MNRIPYTGRVHYVAVPSKKLAFPVGLQIDKLDKKDFETLDSIVGVEEFKESAPDIREEIREQKSMLGKNEKLNLSHNQLQALMKAYGSVIIMKSMNRDLLLLYWLEKNKIPYEVLSEHMLMKKGYDASDWTIIKKPNR